MPTRLPASERTSQRIEQLMNALSPEAESAPSLSQLALRKIIEELLEAEVADRLGRGYYERGGEESQGYRNGHRRGRLQTAEGEVEYSVPQVRGLDEPFRSQIRPELGKRTEALEDLAVEMYARGLSTRDIEVALCDDQGRSLLSRTAVSQVTAAARGGAARLGDHHRRPEGAAACRRAHEGGHQKAAAHSFRTCIGVAPGTRCCSPPMAQPARSAQSKNITGNGNPRITESEAVSLRKIRT